MAALSYLGANWKSQQVSRSPASTSPLTNNRQSPPLSTTETKNGGTKDDVRCFEPIVKKLSLVEKYPSLHFSYETNQNASMKDTDGNNNDDVAAELSESCFYTKYNNGDYVQKERTELSPKDTVTQPSTGVKPIFLQAKRIHQLRREEMYWRMPTAEKTIHRNTFSDKPFSTIPPAKKLSHRKYELVKTKQKTVPRKPNSLQKLSKSSGNVKDPNKNFHTNVRKTTSQAVHYGWPAVAADYKQNPHVKMISDCVLKSGISRQSRSQTTPDHHKDFNKYLEMTRPGRSPLDEEVARTEGTSVDPLVLTSPDPHYWFGLSPDHRLDGAHQPSPASLLNKVNRTPLDKRRLPVGPVDRNNVIEKSGQNFGKKLQSSPESSQYRDDLATSSRQQSGKTSVRHEIKGETQNAPKKRETLALGDKNNKSPKKNMNVQNLPKMKPVLLNSVKGKNTINYPTRSSLTVFKLDSPKEKANSPRIKVPTKPNASKVPFGSAANSAGSLPNKDVQTRQTDAGSRLEPNRFINAAHISRNSKPKLNPKSAAAADQLNYPPEAAVLRGAAYDEYAQTGQRSRYPGNVMEIVNYGKAGSPLADRDMVIAHMLDSSISLHKSDVAKKPAKQHSKERVRNKKSSPAVKHRHTNVKVVSRDSVADKYKTRNSVKKQNTNFTTNKSKLFRYDSSVRRRKKAVRHTGRRAKKHKYLVSKQRPGNKQRKSRGEKKEQTNAVVFIPCGEKSLEYHNKKKKPEDISSHICKTSTHSNTASQFSSSDNIKLSRQNKQSIQSGKTPKKGHKVPEMLKRCNCSIIKKPKRKQRERGVKKEFRTIRPMQRALVNFCGYSRSRRIKPRRVRSVHHSPIGLPWSDSDQMLKEDSATSEEEDSGTDEEANIESSAFFKTKQIERLFRNKISRKRTVNELVTDETCQYKCRPLMQEASLTKSIACKQYSHNLAAKETDSGAAKNNSKRKQRRIAKNRRGRRRKIRNTVAPNLSLLTPSDCLKRNILSYIYSLHKKYNRVPLNSPLQAISSLSLNTDID